jgi:Tfp pilus assembly protein PilO
MKNFSQTKKIIIALIVIDMGMCIGAWFFYGAIIEKNRLISQSQSDIQLQNQIISHSSSLESVLKNTEISRAQVENAILPKDGVVPFVDFVENTAKQNGLTVNVTLDNQPDSQSQINTSYLLMTLDLKGSWKDLQTFISLIETMPYALSITDLQLAKNLMDNSSNNFSSSTSSAWQAKISLQVLEFNK